MRAKAREGDSLACQRAEVGNLRLAAIQRFKAPAATMKFCLKRVQRLSKKCNIDRKLAGCYLRL